MHMDMDMDMDMSLMCMLNVLSIDPFGSPLPIPSHSLGSTRGQIVPRCEFVHIGHGHDFMT